MPEEFDCPYLSSSVELTAERERHIAERHPDLLPLHRQQIAETLANPDSVRLGIGRSQARLFSRWFSDIMGGKHIVVVVGEQVTPGVRYWVVTAYVTRKLGGGEVEWARS